MSAAIPFDVGMEKVTNHNKYFLPSTVCVCRYIHVHVTGHGDLFVSLPGSHWLVGVLYLLGEGEGDHVCEPLICGCVCAAHTTHWVGGHTLWLCKLPPGGREPLPHHRQAPEKVAPLRSSFLPVCAGR